MKRIISSKRDNAGHKRSSPLTIVTRKYDRIKQLLIRTMKLGVNVRHEDGKAMTVSGSTLKLQINKAKDQECIESISDRCNERKIRREMQ